MHGVVVLAGNGLRRVCGPATGFVWQALCGAWTGVEYCLRVEALPALPWASTRGAPCVHTLASKMCLAAR